VDDFGVKYAGSWSFFFETWFFGGSGAEDFSFNTFVNELSTFFVGFEILESVFLEEEGGGGRGGGGGNAASIDQTKRQKTIWKTIGNGQF
jgi:hypothetical protein